MKRLITIIAVLLSSFAVSAQQSEATVFNIHAGCVYSASQGLWSNWHDLSGEVRVHNGYLTITIPEADIFVHREATVIRGYGVDKDGFGTLVFEDSAGVMYMLVSFPDGQTVELWVKSSRSASKFRLGDKPAQEKDVW